MLFQTMSFVKIYAFQKGWEEKNNNYVRYEENNVYLNVKPRKHIALHTKYTK